MKMTYATLTLATAAAVVSGIATTIERVLDQEAIIAKINSNRNSPWKAAKQDFSGQTMEELHGSLGTIVQENAPIIGSSDIHMTDDDIYSLPKAYDVREKWEHCVHPIRNQMKSCWAFGASEVLSDRLCMAGIDAVLSPEYLLACDFMDMGCNGGRLDTVWLYIKEYGLPSDKCEPYTSGTKAIVPICPDTCKDGKDLQKYKASSAYSVVNWLDNPEQRVNKIKKEILDHGPIEAAFRVYADFPAYKSGVYKHTAGGMIGGHAIKIIGWGVEKSAEDSTREIPYWIAANSWGSTWGEDGFFKIAAGTNECNIEVNIWAGMPEVEDVHNMLQEQYII
eukprot:CFRG6075T1